MSICGFPLLVLLCTEYQEKQKKTVTLELNLVLCQNTIIILLFFQQTNFFKKMFFPNKLNFAFLRVLNMSAVFI